MKILVSLALLVVLALPSAAFAVVTGDACTIPAPTISQVGTNGGLSTAPAPNITCTVIGYTETSGAKTFGPIFVPGGGVGSVVSVFRAIRGNTAVGCGYDDMQVFEMTARSTQVVTAADAEKALIGVLDDDGTSTPTGGVQEIKVFGPVGPYVYLTGTATASTSCSATNALEIQLLQYRGVTVP